MPTPTFLLLPLVLFGRFSSAGYFTSDHELADAMYELKKVLPKLGKTLDKLDEALDSEWFQRATNPGDWVCLDKERASFQDYERAGTECQSICKAHQLFRHSFGMGLMGPRCFDNCLRRIYGYHLD
jgi:hypothetical protein